MSESGGGHGPVVVFAELVDGCWFISSSLDPVSNFYMDVEHFFKIAPVMIIVLPPIIGVWRNKSPGAPNTPAGPAISTKKGLRLLPVSDGATFMLAPLQQQENIKTP